MFLLTAVRPPPELSWGFCLVVGTPFDLLQGAHLYLHQRLLSRSVISGDSTLVMPVESTSVCLRSHSIILASGSFSCYGLELLSNCGRELRVPLELQQVAWDSFRVVMEPPLELKWVRSSLVEICNLDPVYYTM